MKEIAGNLKRDVKDLLDESANIVAGFFKQGLCTVRGMADRWKNFTQDISGAVGTLFKPFENVLPPAPSPEGQPMVTVMESDEPSLPVGTRMTLYEAEKWIEDLNTSSWEFDEPDKSVKVAIDYTMGGEQDRYWLPLRIGPGHRPMLNQMEDYVTNCLRCPDVSTQDFYNAPEGLAEFLHEQFGPQLQNDLEKLSSKVLGFFQQHCTISRLEEQFEVQAQAMPEKEQKKFRKTMAETITGLRRAANTGQQQPAAQHEQEQPTRPEAAGPTPSATAPHQKIGQKSHHSVKVKIRQIKEGQPGKPSPHKRRTTPQR